MSVGAVCSVTPAGLIEAALAGAGNAISVVTAIAAQVANSLDMRYLQCSRCLPETDNA
jgi:hypothetical protein